VALGEIIRAKYTVTGLEAPEWLTEGLENLNKEPVDAEVHYLAHTIPEWKYYYDAIDSPAFALSFTANHAHLPGLLESVGRRDLAKMAKETLEDLAHRSDGPAPSKR